MRLHFSLRTVHLAAFSLLLVGLAACGPALTGRYATAGVPPPPAVRSITPAPSPMPAVSTPEPSSATPTAEATLPVPTFTPTAPVQPAVRTGTFPLNPFGSPGASGGVTVTVQPNGFAVTVAATGLGPGSAHAVHLHAGSCAAAFAGRHLLIIGTMVGNGAGVGSLSSRVFVPYAAGRYLIVYANLSPAIIIGCANLGAI